MISKTEFENYYLVSCDVTWSSWYLSDFLGSCNNLLSDHSCNNSFVSFRSRAVVIFFCRISWKCCSNLSCFGTELQSYICRLSERTCNNFCLFSRLSWSRCLFPEQSCIRLSVVFRGNAVVMSSFGAELWSSFLFRSGTVVTCLWSVGAQDNRLLDGELILLPTYCLSICPVF